MDFLDTEEFDGSDLNEKIAAAGAILEKIAEEEGVDINELSDEEVGGLISQIIENKVEEKVEEKVEGANMGEKVSSDVTVADVAIELAKIAAANDIDLDQLSREEYTAAFDELASDMTDSVKLAAQAEYYAQMASADEAGRVMAHAFADELGLTKEAGKVSDAGKAIKGALTRAGTYIGNKRDAIGGKIINEGNIVGRAAMNRAKKKGFKVQKRLPGVRIKDRAAIMGAVKDDTIAKYQRGAGNAVIGLTGLGGAGAVGGTGYALSKKSSDDAFEAAALEIAQEYVDKIASEDAVYERAAEILAENGIEV